MSLKAFESLTLLPSRQLHNSRHESQLAKMMSSTAADLDGHRFLQELLPQREQHVQAGNQNRLLTCW